MSTSYKHKVRGLPGQRRCGGETPSVDTTGDLESLYGVD